MTKKGSRRVVLTKKRKCRLIDETCRLIVETCSLLVETCIEQYTGLPAGGTAKVALYAPIVKQFTHSVSTTTFEMKTRQ